MHRFMMIVGVTSVGELQIKNENIILQKKLKLIYHI